MKTLIKYFALIVLAVAAFSPLSAQQNYVLAASPDLRVSGTSTFHDWTMKSNSGTGKAAMTIENQQLKGISSLQVTMKVETLKSGKSGMDDNAYEALKSEEFPNIVFTLKEIKNIKQQGNTATFTAVGDLTIAGVKRTVTINGSSKISDDKVQFEGKTSFKLTDFKVDPPTAMLGTIRTGDDVTISFNVTFNESNNRL